MMTQKDSQIDLEVWIQLDIFIEYFNKHPFLYNYLSFFCQISQTK